MVKIAAATIKPISNPIRYENILEVTFTLFQTNVTATVNTIFSLNRP